MDLQQLLQLERGEDPPNEQKDEESPRHAYDSITDSKWNGAQPDLTVSDGAKSKADESKADESRDND